ncbi:MAG: hypothetical protein AB7R89_17990 [Dehalococcoidia bacterium]
MEKVLGFLGEVVDQQTFLDGTREFMIEARSDAAAEGAGEWLLTLSFRWLAEIDASVEEGDLSLTGADGAGLYAALIDGAAELIYDEDSAEDVTLLRLTAAVRSGEGRYADWTGSIRVSGRLAGGHARLEAEMDLSSPS